MFIKCELLFTIFLAALLVNFSIVLQCRGTRRFDFIDFREQVERIF